MNLYSTQETSFIRSLSRKSIFKLIILSLLGTVLLGQLMAEEPLYIRGKYAVSGYDTVAYFTENKAVRGQSDHTYEWKGATWLFSTAEHLELFQAEPERYAPQYGGHCAWGLGAKGGLYSADPSAWKIIDDKLYLNFNNSVKNTWLRDTPKFINKGDILWKNILDKQ